VSDDALATDGRIIGRRAQVTRRKLLDGTAQLLEERGALDLKVVDVARHVGTSPATFYQYFTDVEEAILALSDELADHLDELDALATEPWRGPQALEHVRAFVVGFMKFWDDHRAILRVRNLKAEEGDQHFRDSRNRSTQRLLKRLVDKVTEAQAAGRVAPEISAYAAAGAMMSILERLTAYQTEFERRGVGRVQMEETISRLLLQIVRGRRA
jgi:AcrR family transcriptional regulator